LIPDQKASAAEQNDGYSEGEAAFDDRAPGQRTGGVIREPHTVRRSGLSPQCCLHSVDGSLDPLGRRGGARELGAEQTSD
jgi:hypothetical protein